MSQFDLFWLTADIRVVEGFRVLTLADFQALDGDNRDADRQSEMQLKQQLSPQGSEINNNKQTDKNTVMLNYSAEFTKDFDYFLWGFAGSF